MARRCPCLGEPGSTRDRRAGALRLDHGLLLRRTLVGRAAGGSMRAPEEGWRRGSSQASQAAAAAAEQCAARCDAAPIARADHLAAPTALLTRQLVGRTRV